MANIQNRDVLTISIAIVVAGLLIGAGFFLGARELALGISLGANGGAAGNAALAAQNPQVPTQLSPAEIMKNLTPVTTSDHIRGGSLGSKVFLIEYSDLECPFCKRFHDTLKEATAQYSPSEVAWVYRHYPIDSLHSKARKEAEAAECAGDLGGNAKFWAFVDRLFEITPANNGLDLNELPKIAEYVGVDRAKFELCVASGKFARKVSEDMESGNDIGVKGTPYTVVTNGKVAIPVNGAQPIEAVNQAIKAALGR